MIRNSNRMPGGRPDEEPALVMSQKLQPPRWHAFCAVLVPGCGLCAIYFGGGCKGKGWIGGTSRIELHDVKQGINKKEKKK